VDMCSYLFMKEKKKGLGTIVCRIVDHDLLQQEQDLIWKLKCKTHIV